MTTLGCGIDVPEAVVLTLPPGGEQRRCGAVYAEVFGRGRAIVLVPGLGCGANVWGSLVAGLLADGGFEVHAVTLGGFAGTPATEPPLLPRWRADLSKYLEQSQLDRPFLVGHSLGAYLVLAVAIDRGDRIGGVVAVDGVPAIAGLVEPSIDLHAVAADHLRRGAQMDAAADSEWWSSSLRAMITVPEVAQRLGESATRSDPATVRQSITEILLADLRGEMTQIRAPVLAIGALGPYRSAVLRGRHLAAFAAMFLDVAARETVIFEHARHFVMLDAPSRTHAAIVDFIRRHG